MAIDADAALEYVKYELLSYLERRPGAADTLEGVVNWWLFDQRMRTGPDTIARAVGQLVQEGELAERTLADGTIIYSRPQAA